MSTADFVPFDTSVLGSCRAVVRPGLYTVLPRMFREVSYVPNLKDTDVQFLGSPDLGARFIMAEVIMKSSGATRKPYSDNLEHFVYVHEGRIELTTNGSRHEMAQGSYCWLPPKTTFEFKNTSGEQSRFIWLRRRYIPADGVPVPDPLFGNEKDIPGILEGTCMAQYLLPFEKDRGFDLAMNILNFGPSVSFDRAEAHIFEHGAYFLSGRGNFWINGDYNEVRPDDFVYFAPYVPHFVIVSGPEPLRYLLFKNINRDIADEV